MVYVGYRRYNTTMNPVEVIKARLGIADVLGSYIELHKTGGSLKAKCPFHNEKTPSFFVSEERGNYYCFGCGAKGDIFSFVEQFEGLDFKGALKVLAERAGVELKWNRDSHKREDKEILYEIMEEATKFFESNLKPQSEPYEYLIKRGLLPKTIKDFRLGYVSEEWNALENHLRNKAYQSKDIEKAGLIKKGEKGTYYDRFRGRIIFPILDSSGRVIAFTGRILHDDGKSAKYLNSPETPLFIKANVLYGLDKAKLAIRQKGYSILVEGQMDLIMCHQIGINNVIAGSGTALTGDTSVSGAGTSTGTSGQITGANSSNNAEQSRGSFSVNAFGIVKRLSPNIMMVYDSDKAGEKAAERSALIAIDLGMDVKIASLPSGQDPADAILIDPEIFKNALKSARHIAEFLLDIVMRDAPDERRLARTVAERILPIIARLDKHTEQAYLMKVIQNRTNIREDALWEDLRGEIRRIKDKEREAGPNTAGSAVGSTTPKVPKGQSLSRRDITLRKLVGLIEWKKDATDIVIDKYKAGLERISGRKYEDLLAFVKEDAVDIAFEAEQFFSNSPKLTLVADEIILSLENEYLKAELVNKMNEIARAEKSKDDVKAMELLKQCQELSKKINEISQKVEEIDDSALGAIAKK